MGFFYWVMGIWKLVILIIRAFFDAKYDILSILNIDWNEN